MQIYLGCVYEKEKKHIDLNGNITNNIMQGKKTSSEMIAAVCAAKVADPELSLRDIEAETGINYGTVNNILNEELPGLLTSFNKEEESLNFFRTNMEIIRVGNEKVKNAMISMKPEDIKEAEIFQRMVDKSFLQNRLVDDKSTSNAKLTVEGIDKMSTDEIQKQVMDGIK